MSDPVVSHDHSIVINAAPEAVYALVSDLCRHGEWSTQNVGGTWREGCTGKVGDWFDGNNKAGKLEWSAPVEITEADPGKAFGFWTAGKAANMAHWRYAMAAEGSGTRLTEEYRLYNAPDPVVAMGLDNWSAGVKAGMEHNLAAIKATAEAGG